MPDIDAVLLDIEGTLSSQAFVVGTLFAYARNHLPDFVAAHAHEPEVAQILDETRALTSPGESSVATLLRWIDEDRKVAPLKALQGMIWEQGYEAGALSGHIFPDALDALRRWHAAGVPLHIFSSGSVQCQVGFFRRVPQGDLRSLFGRHFDLGIGPKIEASSYSRIAAALDIVPARLLFFSDHARELVAARAAGLHVVQVIREQTAPDPRFAQIRSFDEYDLFGSTAAQVG